MDVSLQGAWGSLRLSRCAHVERETPASGRVNIEQSGTFQQLFLLHGATVPFLNKCFLDFSDRLLSTIVYFDNDLVDDGPVTVFDSPNNVQLALLSIDFEQADSLDPVLPDDVGNGCQSTLASGLAQPVGSEFTDKLFKRLIPRSSFASENVPHHGLDGFLVFAFIGVEAGKDGGLLIKCEASGFGPIG